MLAREVFVDVEALTGKRFDLDACCDESGVNSLCADFCSPAKSFLSSDDVCGKHVWLHPPTGRIGRFVKRYLKCKAKPPDITSACVLVPAWQTAKWRHLLSGMKLLKQFAKGSMLFTQAGSGGGVRPLGPSPWDVEIWYDPPCVDKRPKADSVPEMTLHVSSADVGQLDMAFPGSVDCVPACVLVDSGASQCFVDRAFVLQHKLQEFPAAGLLHCAGQQSAPVKGYVKARVRVQALSEVVKMFVVDVPTPGLHVILGQDWLRQRKGVVSYADGCVNFWRGGRRAKLKCAVGDPALPPPPPLPSCSLNYMQFQKAVKEKRTRYFVVNVMAAKEADKEADDSCVDGEPETQCDQRFKSVLHPVVEANRDVFAELPPGLLPERGVGHTISTGNSQPVSKSMYRLSPKEKAEVERQLSKLLDKGFIQPSGLPGVLLSSLLRRNLESCGCVLTTAPSIK